VTTQNLAALSIAAGTTATMAQHGSRVLVVNSFAVATGGRLDLKDNDMIVHAAPGTLDTAFAAVYGALIRGWAGGMMDGDGMMSSTARDNPNLDTFLGFAKNSILGLTEFAGQAVDSNSILIKYTYFGDVELNGQVNADDLTVFANNFGALARFYSLRAPRRRASAVKCVDDPHPGSARRGHRVAGAQAGSSRGGRDVRRWRPYTSPCRAGW
jgi:hypothetical protein